MIKLETSPTNFIGYEVFPVYSFIPCEEVGQQEITNFLHVKLGQ